MLKTRSHSVVWVAFRLAFLKMASSLLRAERITLHGVGVRHLNPQGMDGSAHGRALPRPTRYRGWLSMFTRCYRIESISRKK